MASGILPGGGRVRAVRHNSGEVVHPNHVRPVVYETAIGTKSEAGHVDVQTNPDAAGGGAELPFKAAAVDPARAAEPRGGGGPRQAAGPADTGVLNRAGSAARIHTRTHTRTHLPVFQTLLAHRLAPGL